jgi:hypothetical protein
VVDSAFPGAALRSCTSGIFSRAHDTTQHVRVGKVNLGVRHFRQAAQFPPLLFTERPGKELFRVESPYVPG